MAVTVTNAIATSALHAIATLSPWVGSYGAPANAVVEDVAVVADKKRVKVGKITLSGTYATGGFTLTPSAYGLKSIDGLAIICDNLATSGAVAVPNLATAGESPVVKLVVDNAGTELSNTTSVTNMSFEFIMAGV